LSGHRATRTFAIWVAAALSGGAALAYEICWSRALVVPLGNSTDAAALVLSGFMLGMAVGARLGGSLAERAFCALRLYALLELGLGLYAVVAPSLIALLSTFSAGSSPSATALAVGGRWVAAFVLIVLPSLAMGATLPLLVRALTGPRAPLSLQISLAYGANTAGAAAGALLTGFWALAWLGVWLCSAAAAAASFAAAATALLASLGVARRSPEARIAGAIEAEPATGSGLGHLALAAAFVSGLCMLACELLWARVLTFVFGHDTYALSSLLAFVLCGLALGGVAHRLFARSDQGWLLATLLGLFALFELVSFWAAASLVVRFGKDPFALQAAGSLQGSLRLELYREALYTPLLVLLPAALSGAAFPAACSLYGGSATDAGRKVGVVFLVNGAGSTLGALAAAFGLVTLVGIQGAFFLLALLSAAASAALVVYRPGRRRRAAQLAALAPLAAPALLAALMPRGLPKQMLLKAVGERHQTLLYYEEARTGTISVIRNQINGERQLLINAVNEVTTRLVHDQSFKLLGHLAPLLHPNPRSGVMICLGAGLSAGAALAHPLERLDVVDLSSAVVNGARYFTAENNGVLDDSRLRLHIADGRQFLLNSGGGYDVAIVDSTHPKAVDSWILYTKQFYDLLRSRLAPGGIAVQWVPLHGLSEREFKIIVATFLSVFTEMTLWANVGFETYGQVGYAKLVGVKNGAVSIDYQRLARGLSEPRVGADLGRYGMASPEEILDLYVAGAPALRDWTSGLPVQTDGRPIVAYLTAYSDGRPRQPAILLTVREPVAQLLGRVHLSQHPLRERVTRAYEAQGLVLAGHLERAAQRHPTQAKIRRFQRQTRSTLDYYSNLAARYPDDPDRLFEAATQLATLGHPKQARPVFEQALALRPDDFRIRLNLALLRAELGEHGAAIEQLSWLRSDNPTSAIVHQNLGTVLLAGGDASAATAHLQQALAWDPSSLGASLALAQAHLELGETDRAQAVAEHVLAHNRWVAEAHDLLGLVADRRSDHHAAIGHHTSALRLQPYQPSFHYNLGVALQGGGLLGRAASAYRAALDICPDYAAAWNNLGLVHTAQGRFERAADLYLRALDADPGYGAAAHNLGLALVSQHRSQDAVQAFCLALRLGPNPEATRQQLRKLHRKPEDCAR
jgi:spermidine synthase